MTTDFAIRRVPGSRVASIQWKGGYSEATIRAKFEAVETWARSKGVPTGRWIFREPGDRTWWTGIEVKRPVRSDGKVKVRNLPAVTVATITFDPDVVSPRVIYHGLYDWLRWQRKEKRIRAIRSARELYRGNPWKDSKAWSRTEIQFIVTK